MTNPEKKKAVLYAREVPEPEPDPERFVYLLDKWDGLEIPPPSKREAWIVYRLWERCNTCVAQGTDFPPVSRQIAQRTLTQFATRPGK